MSSQDYSHTESQHISEHSKKSAFNDYWPLVVILLVITIAAAVQELAVAGWSWMNFAHEFMGLFFLIFALFKFFDLKGFAEGFQMYDLLAQRSRAYALAFPFIEFSLALLYLSRTAPIATNSLTFIIMSVSAVGVIKSLVKGLDFKCACLGTLLKVPLSTVTIVENVGMGLMALWMLFYLVF